MGSRVGVVVPGRRPPCGWSPWPPWCPPPPRPPTPPLTAADVVANTPIPQGTVTPVAPGTKLVSSSVLRMSSAMVGRFTSVRRVLTSGCSPSPPRRGCPPVCTCWCAPPAPRPCSYSRQRPRTPQPLWILRLLLLLLLHQLLPKP